MPCSLAQEAQALDLLEPLDQPLARAVAAVVVGGKVVSSVYLSSSSPLEVGTRAITPTPALGGGRQEVAARVLLEHVVDRLNGRDAARRDRPQPLLAPADRGPERDAVVADLALVAQPLELLEAGRRASIASMRGLWSW